MTSVLSRSATTPSVVHRAFDILGAFAGSAGTDHELTLSDVARRTGMPKTTVHRLLATLVDIGALDVEAGRFRISLSMLPIVTASPEAAVRSTAMPYLLALHRAVGHTIHLCVLRGSDVVYLEKLHGPESRLFPTDVGMSLPAHCTAVGKSLLAASDQDADSIPTVRRMTGLTERSVVDPIAIRASLAQIRQRGIATDVDESVLGRSCVARPIMVAGMPVAAVSVGYPTTSEPRTHLVPPLVKIVDSIGRALSTHPSQAPRRWTSA